MCAQIGATYESVLAGACDERLAKRRGRLASVIILFKLRIVGLVLITGLVSMLAAGGGLVPARVGLFLLGGALAAAGAAALNHYLDRDIDGLMERTRSRPLPTGALAPRTALALGLGMLALALTVLTPLGAAVMAWTAMAAVFYVGVYSLWLKRRTPWNVVIGGWCGSCAVLAGWEASGMPLTVGAWALSAVVFCWTPAHFWSLAIERVADYRRAGIPMLPVVKGVSITARSILCSGSLAAGLSMVPWITGEAGNIYAVVAAVASGAFVWRCVELVRSPVRTRAFSTYKLSGVYLALLFVGMAIDRLV